MEIRRITSLSAEDLSRLGHFGYRSAFTYELVSEETDQGFSLGLKLVRNEEPYVKIEMNDEDDLRRYGQMVQSEYAAGIVVDGRLAALAITEKQSWNNTLMIWHFQVHEHEQRKGYGAALMTHICDYAGRQGFRAVTVETQNTNVPAVHFYRSCGFQLEGIDKSFYTNNEDGLGEVALFMRKLLNGY